MNRTFVAVLAAAALTVPALASKPDPNDTTAAPERVSDASDRMICKTYAETGSLVRTHKVCATKHDWEAKRAELRSISGVSGCRAMAEGGHC